MPEDEPSPFEILETRFRVIGSGPGGLAVDGATLGLGLPPRPVPLLELRCRVLSPAVSFCIRDAVLRSLVERAQRDGGEWQVAVAGILLPGLRRASRHLRGAWPRQAAELEAEILAGLVTEVARFDLGERWVASRLISRSVHHGRRLLNEELAYTKRIDVQHDSAPPPRPFGHPDFVLARAVEEKVISAEDSQLIGETRLGGVLLLDVACARGVGYDALRKQRQKAERGLAKWLGQRNFSDHAPGPPHF